jgi:hypothetical protein
LPYLDQIAVGWSHQVNPAIENWKANVALDSFLTGMPKTSLTRQQARGNNGQP